MSTIGFTKPLCKNLALVKNMGKKPENTQQEAFGFKTVGELKEAIWKKAAT